MPSTSPSSERYLLRRSSVVGGFLALGLVFSPMSPASTQPQAGAPMQAERVAVGDEAIDFSLESIDGERYRLSDLRGEKNAIIIFFRGTW